MYSNSHPKNQTNKYCNLNKQNFTSSQDLNWGFTINKAKYCSLLQQDTATQLSLFSQIWYQEKICFFRERDHIPVPLSILFASISKKDSLEKYMQVSQLSDTINRWASSDISIANIYTVKQKHWYMHPEVKYKWNKILWHKINSIIPLQTSMCMLVTFSLDMESQFLTGNHL